MFDLILKIFSTMIMFILVLVGLAFLTLFERKLLGYIQIRKGPNKVGFFGIVQPFGDAIKLFCKEQTYPHMSNYNLYYVCPIMNLLLSLLLWSSIPFFSFNISFDFSILFFLCISSVSVYTIMLSGWSSNSLYSLLGCLRSVAQTISYEVSLIIVLMSFMFMMLSLNFMNLFMFQYYVWFLLLMYPLCLIWLVSGLAETNRTPFDFAEGESELVSGFNVEYSSGGFAMIFMAEYGNILLMSLISCLLFLGGNLMNLFFYVFVTMVAFFWVWVRGTLPRFRYDKLMYLAWKSYLPVSLNYLFMYESLKLMFLIF
uniref:NADH dehydrogenase subunit 1 n=1 Tax=Aoria nigripes TaxID=2954116 RepID=UPI002114C274|nr:NADH dehydrogenase subunit 1 [Aoria nigripes]USM11445.1 NADH dehydrogenase subunit 1 [Aoria nigripes]